MGEMITAVYERGALRPLTPLKLREHQRVRIQVVTEDTSEEDEREQVINFLVAAGLVQPKPKGPVPPDPLSRKERQALANTRLLGSKPRPRGALRGNLVFCTGLGGENAISQRLHQESCRLARYRPASLCSLSRYDAPSLPTLRRAIRAFSHHSRRCCGFATPAATIRSSISRRANCAARY